LERTQISYLSITKKRKNRNRNKSQPVPVSPAILSSRHCPFLNLLSNLKCDFSTTVSIFSSFLLAFTVYRLLNTSNSQNQIRPIEIFPNPGRGLFSQTSAHIRELWGSGPFSVAGPHCLCGHYLCYCLRPCV
jgi:hypothetical protein